MFNQLSSHLGISSLCLIESKAFRNVETNTLACSPVSDE